MLRLQYDIAPADLEAVCRQYFRTEMRPILRWSAPPIVILALLAAVLAGRAGALALFLLVVLLMTAAVAYLWAWIGLRRAIAIVRPVAAAVTGAIPVLVTTGEDGVTTQVGEDRGVRPWATVHDMCATRDYLVIRFRDGAMTFAPKRCLTEAEVAAFHAEAARRGVAR